MKSFAFNVLAFTLATGVSQAATVDNVVQANYGATSLYNYDPQAEPLFLTIEDYRDISTSDGSTASDLLVSTDEDHAALGAKFDISSSSDASLLASKVGVRWDPPSDSNVKLTNFNGNSYVTSNFSDTASRPGKIRFNVEYDLYASGEGIYSSVTFTGGSTPIDALSTDSQSESNYASFSDYVLGGADPVSKKGVWTSDWLSFSSSTELEGYLDSLRPAYSYYSTAGVYASSSTIGTFTDQGAIDGHANLKLSYEIVHMQQPVPEPETYALMVAGLIGVAWARRSAKARI